MEDNEDQELEQYVSQHKDETLRQIREGMLKECGRTKSTKWIGPRRAAALLVEDLIDEEAEESLEEEIEGKDETSKEEEDPEIIAINKEIKNINLQTRRKEAKQRLTEATLKLALKEHDVETVGDLELHLGFMKKVRRKDREFISLLKERLEVALQKAIPTYVTNAKCNKCDGWFLWRHLGDDPTDKYVRCFVCQTEYKLVD